MKKKQSRRKFIGNSVKLMTAFIGTISLGKFSLFAQNSIIDNTKQINISNKQKSKTLITYESKFGSTKEIALYISKNLKNTNQIIDVKSINKATNLSNYTTVIIGSAIQYDKWMPEATAFILKNEAKLVSKNVSFFLVCLVLSKKTKKATLKANSYANKIKNLTPKINIKKFGKFAGVLNYKKMSFGQRILAKGIFAVIGVKEGDYRDWDSIKKWSNSL